LVAVRTAADIADGSEAEGVGIADAVVGLADDGTVAAVVPYNLHPPTLNLSPVAMARDTNNIGLRRRLSTRIPA
jgi:hypothetical protein